MELSEQELKDQLEVAETKKDQDARIILDEAMQKISELNRTVTASLTLIGNQTTWKLHIIRK